MAKNKSPHHAVKLDSLLDAKLAAKLAETGIERVHHTRNLTDGELKDLKGIGAKAVSVIRAAVA